MSKKIISLLCIGLMCGQVLAQEVVPALAATAAPVVAEPTMTPAEFAAAYQAYLNPVAPSPKLGMETEDNEEFVERNFSDKHPYLYAGGWTLVILVLGYALFAAIDKAGGSTHTTYNIGGDYQNSESNNNGGNGSSDASDTEQDQSGEGSNSND